MKVKLHFGCAEKSALLAEKFFLLVLEAL